MMPHIIHELAHAMPSQQRAQLFPPPGSEAETIAFQQLQTHFAAQYEAVFPHPLAAKTVVIVPSLTLDQEILAKVNGHVFYEERLLCLLMLLRMPRTHVIYITSVPVDPCIIDYYLHLLPGITGYHARQRLHLLSCFDASAQSLTQKILTRPRLMARLQQCIPNGHPAHIACFNVTDLEKTLAVRLGLPIYGCDPALAPLGSKSGSRQLFRQCGVPVPPGFENLRNETEVAMALTDLKKAHPTLRKAVVKLNEGFSGDGNALFDYQGLEPTDALAQQLQDQLPQRLKIVAHQLGYAGFMQKLSAMHGVAEAFVEGDTVTSPSVQCRISPLGQVDVVSTHDQVLGGESGQVFMGAHFPARADYATELGHMGHTIGQAMKERGVLGRFGVDFMSVRQADGWHHYAIEINLRKGGTTHPFLMLQFLTNGQYHANTGRYTIHDGQERFYFATDNLQNDRYKGLTPHDLIDIAMCHGLHYNGSSEEGVMFHLIGTLSQYGKLGMVCVGKTMQRAEAFYQQTIRVLEGECTE